MTDKPEPAKLPIEDCLHVYRCDVLRVLDGDTIDVHVDLGFGVFTRQRLRIYGVNSPEKDTDAGKDALLFVSDLLYQASEVLIRTMKQSSRSEAEKREKFGRYLVHLVVDGEPLTDLIIKAGHGKAYFGGKRD
jgi:micrococcal nuclease